MNRLHGFSTECRGANGHPGAVIGGIAFEITAALKTEKLSRDNNLRWSGRLDSNQRPFAPEA
jgi:hypothetical protein